MQTTGNNKYERESMKSFSSAAKENLSDKRKQSADRGISRHTEQDLIIPFEFSRARRGRDKDRGRWRETGSKTSGTRNLKAQAGQLLYVWMMHRQTTNTNTEKKHTFSANKSQLVIILVPSLNLKVLSTQILLHFVPKFGHEAAHGSLSYLVSTVGRSIDPEPADLSSLKGLYCFRRSDRYFGLKRLL